MRMNEAKKPDRRVERTRRLLLSAFNEIIVESGFDAITVRDIIDRADVGRSTFYEHFDGKEDLLEQSVASPFGVLADAVTERDRTAQTVAVLTHFRERGRIARAFLAGPARRIVSHVLAELIEVRLPARSRRTGGESPLPAPLLAAQIAEAQIGLLEAWIVGRAQCPAEDVARAMVAGTRAILAALI